MSGHEAPKAPAAEAAAPPDPEQRTFMGNLQVAAFVAIVVAIECGAAYAFLPSTSEVAAMAAEQVKKKQHVEAEAEKDHAHHDAPETVEVDLGKFAVTATQPSTGIMLRISFSLWGTVTVEESEHFGEAYERTKNRIRQEVIFIARQLDGESLSDPNLGMLKRKILDKVNHALGKDFLQTVVFSEFSYVDH